MTEEKPWVAEYLEKKKAKFDLVRHGAVYKPVDSAKARKVHLSQIAKALLYIADKKPVLVVLPGNLKADTHKIKEVLGAKEVFLAKEEEVKKYTGCVIGLVPPTIEKIQKIIDKELLKNEKISFNAGIATAGIIIEPKELLDVLDNVGIADISTFDSDIIIGLEIHIELDTNSKLFCSCSTENTEQPNSHTCPVCLGHPGSKPVLNKQAVDFAIRLCLALNCSINPKLIFSRKVYFYPDMAKNYQITQYEIPLGTGGKLTIGEGKEVGIVRVHMEEDPASLVHIGSMDTSPFVLVDYNRSGRPLSEVVTKPDMTNPDEARDFMKKLITILNYIGIFDQNNCIIKADANVSIKESGYVRAEVKNITGFKEIERALRYEVERQKRDFKEGKKLIQETRAWDSDKGITTKLRTKETEDDYGYILDPDLVVTEITNKWVDEVKKEMPELAQDKVQKYVSKYKIDRIDAEVIAAERPLAEMFEEVAKKINPVMAAKWMRRELVRVMNYNEKTFDDIPIKASHIIELLEMVEKKEITENVAKKIMEKFMDEAFSPRAYAKEHGLKVVADASELEKICKEVIKENPKAVEEYKAGNEKSFNFLVGQVMRRTKGQASPKELNDILKKLL